MSISALPPLQNTRSWRPVVQACDRVASRSAVDRVLTSLGLSRAVIEGAPVFIPCALQAAFAEAIARHLGERHIGPVLVGQYGYEDLDLYAQYVLDAPRLDIAFARGVRALPVLQSGACVTLRDAGDSVVLQFGSGIHSVAGARHVDEGTPLLLIDLARHFLGPDWHPEWVELPKKPLRGNMTLETAYEVPIHFGCEIPGIAVSNGDLQTLNPRPRAARNAVVFGDLREMVRQGPPSSVAEVMRQTLALAASNGDLNEESVAARLGLGRRTLQRHLQAEGCTFRQILTSFRVDRAKALLRETDLSVQAIATSLGYLEVNSFRRTFHRGVGITPTEFSARTAAGNRA